ncbi:MULTISPECIES: alpha/beta hydrolase [unclassified Halomonas]|uniref:alpha/beta hydrolase n=1 Tax=unclassified Halomonas TaxID=2609666 RepID=UPI0007D98261|nr:MULTISPECIES: alpha/beta hydrolase [unclassified Halomonas]MBT2787135.1 alpha/beta hydrolase [Halomonas sp. ISL-106]MBT2795477.1 alpha/beta hydrolase [Halomonas sp. ISL-104]OAL57974.1 pectin acetylesterase [Halomonas sp. ALS9]
MAETLQHEAVLPLWNERPTGTPVDLAPVVEERSNNLFRADRALTGIAAPSITAWVPEHPNGTSIIIAPGGSYRRVVLDKEGIEIARALAPYGVTSFLLTYRLPGEGHANRAEAPLADAQRAMRLVRGHAGEWGLDPERIGFLGFSAAGHLGASLATGYDRAAYQADNDEQSISARPNFVALVYPVVTMQDEGVHEGSRTALLGDSPSLQHKCEYSPEEHVSADAPETFMVLADDDPSVPPANAVAFYSALHAAGVKAELHIFRDGGHGFGIEGAQNKPVAAWPQLLAQWMRQIGVMPGLEKQGKSLITLLSRQRQKAHRD